MRITIEATKEEFQEIQQGRTEFIEAHIREVDIRWRKWLIVKNVVGVSVNRRKGTMLIQVEGRTK
jgi:hypothetical protein